MQGRENLDKYISETYGITSEYPWIQYPSFAVYRHMGNKKWFAVVMNLPVALPSTSKSTLKPTV